jgi:hypothetical protein
MVTLLSCLAWGILAFPFFLLARIGAKPTPRPPEVLPSRNLAAGSRQIALGSSTPRYVLTVQ